MKKFLTPVWAAVILASSALAGPDTYSSQRSKETVAPPCPAWYADREWNVSLWGTYAFPHNDYPTLQNAGAAVFVGPGPSHDRYLDADHAWGGGIDAKYFFARYFGIGIQGYALDVRQSYPDMFVNFFDIGGGTNFARTSHERRAIGSVLGTFTLRYPIGCSRFAPYLFAGGGVIMGGGQVSVIDSTTLGDISFSRRSGSTTQVVGQFGGGIEVRLTPHVGFINDFSWNVIDGRNNNFGMMRTGINFAF